MILERFICEKNKHPTACMLTICPKWKLKGYAPLARATNAAFMHGMDLNETYQAPVTYPPDIPPINEAPYPVPT